MPDKARQKKINWQPIRALPLIASMIDRMLDEVEKQYENLQTCRLKPHVLDNDTVRRIIHVYTVQSVNVWLYEEQLLRWTKLELDLGQRQEVDRLTQQVPRMKDRISRILSLAAELRGGTIEAVLAKNDFELGLEHLLGKSSR